MNESASYSRERPMETVAKEVAGETEKLRGQIEAAFAAGGAVINDPGAMGAFLALRGALEEGIVRAAEPDLAAPTGWRVNAWVKRGILLGFRLGRLTGSGSPPAYSVEGAPEFPFIDKDTFPQRLWPERAGVRIVPGGTAVRAGAYLAPGVVCMPPSYVNAGAYVDAGTMIDSHALVGSCAQVGRSVHLSAAAQLGGVLEPVNASPVILEDEVLVGGNCGIYEGTIVRRGAVLAAGTILTRGTPVYDVVHGTVIRAGMDGEGERPLIIPENAVVVPGARAIAPGKLPPQVADWSLSLYTPVIVKYRDAKTELSLALEDLLR